MFCGKEIRRFDEKWRISFNRGIRKELGNIPVITRRGKKIRVFPEQKKDEFKPSQIWLGKIDKQGRLLIPKKLLSGFLKSIILSGERDYLEIQSRKRIPFREITLDETGRGISILYDGDKKEVREEC